MLNQLKKLVKKDVPSKLKGMQDLTNENYYLYQGLFEKAQEVAIYYGFKPIETPILEREDLFTTSIGEGTDIIEKEMYTLRTKGGDKLAMRPEYTAGIMRAYIEHGMQTLPQPVMLYYSGSCFRHENPQRGRLRELRQFGLEIIGTEKSITDAMIIRTTATILEEFGLKDSYVDINSMGDKDSRAIYVRELTNYYKKHSGEICNNCTERLKTNPLRLLDCKEERCQPLKEHAPASISYLNHASKQHLKEVLENLEEAGIAYRINNNLVRGLSYYTRTVFEFIEPAIEEGQAPLTIAGGGRYDYLGRMLGAKKDTPAVGMGLGLDRVVQSAWRKDLCPRILKKPKICFIQLGIEAKMKSLRVIEILRKAKIPIVHALSKDSLMSQLSMAEELQVPYAIIFGQKEAIDDSVIVRNMEHRSQESVKIEHLSDYLKKL